MNPFTQYHNALLALDQALVEQEEAEESGDLEDRLNYAHMVNMCEARVKHYKRIMERERNVAVEAFRV
jgi:hypothetical protein